MEHNDLLDKLHDYNKKTDIQHDLLLRSDGSGWVAMRDFPFDIAFQFTSLQDYREKTYREVFNQLKQ